MAGTPPLPPPPLPPPPTGTEHAVCLVTVPTEELGTRIARALVNEKLAACVNIIQGVRSIYSWQGQVCDDPELLLVVKTRAALVGALSERVKQLHAYELPETIALPVTGGSAAYLRWVEECTER